MTDFDYTICKRRAELKVKVGQINHTDSVPVIVTFNGRNLGIGENEDAERDEASEEREVGDRQKVGVPGRFTNDESGDADDESDEEDGEGNFRIVTEVGESLHNSYRLVTP